MGVVTDCIGLMQDNFSDYLETFEMLSADVKNNELLLNSQIKAFNFDKLKKIIPSFNRLCSCDALYLTNSINFFEFKNTLDPKAYMDNIYKSAIDSYVILNYIMHLKNRYIDLRNLKVTFTLVFKFDNNSREALAIVQSRRLNWLSQKFTHMFENMSTEHVNLKEYFIKIDCWLDKEFDNKISLLK